MRAFLHVSARAASAAMILLTIPDAAPAQLPTASSAAVAMGGNFTAIARGFEAIALNPANLAMPGRPGFSLGVAIAGANAGMAPIDLNALHKFSGRLVDSVTRVSWVDQSKLAGGQRGRVDAGVTWLAMTVGPIGVQLGSTAYTNINLSPDAWESVLFGNAGRTGGQPKTLDFAGTTLRSAAFTTGGLSFALPIPINITNGILSDEHAAIGITAKGIVGHGLAVAQDDGSSIDPTNMQLRFPVVTVRTDQLVGSPIPQSDYNGVAGVGVGADLAASWSGGPWRVGLLAENVFNTFKWDTTKLAFMPGTGSFTIDSSQTNFDQQAYAGAPQALRDIVDGQKYKPAISLGAALKISNALTLTGDIKKSLGSDESIIIGPRSRFGFGAEFRILPMLPLRAGIASVSDGWQAGAGFGLQVLGFELGVASTIRQIGAARQSGVMVGLVGIGR
jgi:hypothetical protein